MQRQYLEHGLVGGVVAYEYRNAPGKRRALHQSNDGAPFAVLHRFDFDDRFAAQDLQVGIRLVRNDRGNLAVERFALLRCQSIMQGKRSIFVFGDNAAVERCRERQSRRLIDGASDRGLVRSTAASLVRRTSTP